MSKKFNLGINTDDTAADDSLLDQVKVADLIALSKQNKKIDTSPKYVASDALKQLQNLKQKITPKAGGKDAVQPFFPMDAPMSPLSVVELRSGTMKKGMRPTTINETLEMVDRHKRRTSMLLKGVRKQETTKDFEEG